MTSREEELRLRTGTHTPGTWADRWDEDGGAFVTGDGTVIADMVGPKERRKANARLIASAPELLKALKYARRFLRGIDHDVDYVDAVIAKAEGRS
jgi:hypothetical protein